MLDWRRVVSFVIPGLDPGTTLKVWLPFIQGVIARLDRAIHLFFEARRVDAPVKPGHDGLGEVGSFETGLRPSLRHEGRYFRL